MSGPDHFAAAAGTPARHVVDGCLTCGDVALPVTVLEAGHPDAVCADGGGTVISVGVELVAPVAPGDRLLVHGGVAIARLREQP